MSRMASPPLNLRDAKRPRIAVEPEAMAESPENVADIVPDGDAVLIVSGMSTAPEKQIGLRVSSTALGMVSPVFKDLFATTADRRHGEVLYLTIPVEDNGDAIFILCNILHLRNDKLAPRIPPDLLCKVAKLARKYDCVVAASRATLQWFDRLYTSKDPGNLWTIIEAAYFLDEATYFARFTTRWVLQALMQSRDMPLPTTIETAQLSLILCTHHTANTILLRQDLDSLASSCIFAFTKDYKHYIDWAPNMSPEPDETPDGKAPVKCRVDPDGAAEYLGALRDAEIYPSSAWKVPNNDSKGDTIGSIVEKLAAFREPEYDDVDKCEFCEGIRGKFMEELERLRTVHRERLWGVCLDCYKAGGVNVGECRVEHAKTVHANGTGAQ